MLIALHGRSGAGKDTVARHLIDARNFSTIAFANPVKDMLVALGVPRVNLIDPVLKEQVIDWIGQSPRQLMQSLGTEWGRGHIDDEIWLRHAERRIQYVRRISPNIIVTDVRYPNEARWVRAQGGRIWHILRDGITTAHSDHDSEARLPIEDDDPVIHNNGGVDELLRLVDLMLTRVEA